MALSLGELKQWPPEIADVAQAAREAADNHTGSAEFYRSLITVSTWEGQGAEAAKSAMTATAADHEAVADNLGAAAQRMENVHRDAEALAETIKGILDDAAAQPAVGIDESTNQVIPPDTSHMTEEYAAQVAAKVTDLRERIADALADGERIDTELAGAITAASGERVVKTAGSLEDMLLPATGGRRDEPKPDEQSSTPKNLDEALDRIAEPGQPAQPVRLDPAAVEQFKDLARETMLHSGVPPEQIEQRLDAMVAAAHKPLAPVKTPERDAMPKPSFEDGFADGWFGTEESIKNLIGANGLEDLKESWTDLAKGTWERVTNPIDSMKEDIEHLTKYPEHYFGEVAGSTALTAPSAMFGGEAALGARAAIPDDVIDMPSHTGTVEHSTPLADLPSHTEAPLATGHPPLPLGDAGYSPDAPLVASNLNEAFVNGSPTTDLAREVAQLSTHRFGDVDRVVLGKWDGLDGGYIGEARANGGIYYDTGPDTWNAIGDGLSKPDANAVGWLVNEQFLKTQMESGVARIDYIVEGTRFSSVDDVVRTDPDSFSAMEIKYLVQNAPSYGYERVGNSWVKKEG
ncbi:hypothetical protein AU184_22835 [Mycolicibacterium novocastrense]|uniref:WXG100 family type VII secretion target n=1 Tax=Mycolicibacterium novocastrense TaxID=59813 RepID=UPI000749653D|nr:hypothetical protein [Mycolicibacterium novocastrense]KUH67865.1 hypothetical protein AU072_24905 [Mycolicibacterium novocastrense]KUH68338.1 hypothetical protein AU184_22835 [Mycolicibacterium novocastrense]KUH73417.1 hypothetical protein AU183_23725 [Mycolicibacterium novocastrense]